MLTVGSLFAGIGGFDLGLERAGMQVKWQVEIDPYCLKVLEKHWPYVKRYTDIKTVDWSGVEPVDLVCGGFPCQPVSAAGKQKGKEDARWLWPEITRCLCVLRPRYVFIENVPGILVQGFADVITDLAFLGFDAEWQVLSAASVGAPHLRRRVWIVAYPKGKQSRRIFESELPANIRASGESEMADSDNTGSQRRNGSELSERAGEQPAWSCSPQISYSESGSEQRSGPQCDERQLQNETLRGVRHSDYWQVEPNVGRVADGIPARVDRLRSLGNSIVPQIAEWIGWQIIKAHKESLA